MGRGPDLTGVERAIIHAKIMANWDSEKNRIKHGKIYEIQKLCAKSGIRVSKGSVMRLAGEMKAQEEHAEKVFQETGEVTGMDFSGNRKGSGCGTPDKLTEEVKEAYREIVGRYAYAWTFLSQQQLTDELKKKGHTLTAQR